MQRLLFIILLLPFAGMLLLSCKKETAGSYVNDPAIYLSDTGDSLRYSFAIRPSTILKDTIWLNVRISGDSASTDRIVSLATADGITTAVKDVHYKLGTYMVPANKFTARLPVVVYRTADLLTKEVVIGLRLNASDAFKMPFNTGKNFRILLNDILTKPTNWDGTLAIRFGTYSRVKYKFMIDVLGSDIILKLNGTSVLLNEMFYYKQKVVNAWNDYVVLHGPQVDENGLAIVFP